MSAACLPFRIDSSLIGPYIILDSLNVRKQIAGDTDSDLKTHEALPSKMWKVWKSKATEEKHICNWLRKKQLHSII